MKDIIWRPYQIDSFKAIKEGLDRGVKKQLCVQATGCGKRMQSCYVSQRMGKSLFLAHSEELIDQAYEDMIKFHNFMDVGIVKGSRMDIGKKVIVASPQTLHRRLDKFPENYFDLVQADEVHRYMAPTFLKSIEYFTPRLFIGWTATPKRLDGISLRGIADEIVFEYNLAQAIQEGYLCELKAYRINTSTSLDGVKKVGGDFNEGQLNDVINTRERNVKIVNEYKAKADGRQFIAFCVTQKHAVDLAQAFRDYEINVEVVVSDESICSDRKGAVNRFKSGQVQGLINVMILTEGFDYNDVGCVIQARPTMSLAVYMQQIGRGTRLKSEAFKQRFGTDNCIVLDIVDNSSNNAIINTFNLDKGKEAGEKIFVNKEERDKLFKVEQERKMKSIIRETVEVDLFKLPEVKIWSGAWSNDAATEKQIDFLKRLGIWQDDIEYSKGMVSELISNAPAEPWQIQQLARWKYDVSGVVTFGQYKLAKERFEKRNKYLPEHMKK